MPSTFSRVFTQTIGQQNRGDINRHLPMINAITTTASSYMYQVNQIRRKQSLMLWYKNIGELTGFVNKVARDVTGRYHFEPVKETESGRNKVMKANKFALQVQLRKLMKSQAVDILVTGEAYGWMGKLTDSMIKKAISDSIIRRRLSYKANQYPDIVKTVMAELKAEEGLANIDSIDEDILRPRKYRMIPSSTMENIHDRYDFLYYNHVVGGEYERFMPDEVIRFTFQDVDGKPNGFTPVDAVIVQLELLRFMWQNMMSIHKNGGAMDKIVSYKDVNPSSPSFKKTRESFLKYKNVENRHGLYLTTGDMTVEDLNSIEAMQFKDMGLYITGLIALQWGIPRSSIPYIVGDSNTKADTGGDSERGYWEVIRDMQKTYAETMNTQLWIPHFGVKLVFENSFIHRDIQGNQAKQLKIANLTAENSLWASDGKQLDSKTLMKELGRTDINLAEKNMEMFMLESGGGNMLNDQQPLKKPTDDSQNVRNAKRDEQTSLQESTGKPSGMGKSVKEIDTKSELEYKEMMGYESKEVNIHDFVEEYKLKQPSLFMYKNDSFITYMFKSNEFMYKTIIKSSDKDYINEIINADIYRI